MTGRTALGNFAAVRSSDTLGEGLRMPLEEANGRQWERPSNRIAIGKARGYGRIPQRIRDAKNGTQELSSLQKLANEAWLAGARVWSELENSSVSGNRTSSEGLDACPQSIFLSQEELQSGNNVALLPCGLMLGSSITVIGRPLPARWEYISKLYRTKARSLKTLVSQFMVELQGLKVVDGEEPPRILHVNPRLKGDWSGKAVFEVNTCYRGQWGVAQRCSGLESQYEDETVDGLPKCERWVHDDEKSSKDTKSTSWLDRLMGYTEKPSVDWQYPFLENQSFVFTIRAGWEGYHMSVDGRHVASSPYRTGFILEEATGFAIKGDVEVYSVVATSLPLTHPNLSPQKIIETVDEWKAPPIPTGPIEFFIGILSASNHFAERMAVRKTWMQSRMIQSSKVVARFFVALHASMEVNVQLKKEASFYGDVIILPFVDRYELLVLKTVALCEYAIQNISAKYIMKCDDDNFVRVDTVVLEVKATGHEHGLYMGNINLDHKPLRLGKWAVSYEEWPEEDYPPYANGPGYIITRDIAAFIVSQHMNHTLRLFKMEDVSMGMWVVQYNLLHEVQYRHSWKFCQFGCIEDYFTAHYQSPRQILCMWEKLSHGKAECCNMRK